MTVDLSVKGVRQNNRGRFGLLDVFSMLLRSHTVMSVKIILNRSLNSENNVIYFIPFYVCIWSNHTRFYHECGVLFYTVHSCIEIGKWGLCVTMQKSVTGKSDKSGKF